MTRSSVPADETFRSEITDELDRIREKRVSQESEKSEADEAVVARQDDLPPTKLL